MNKTFLLAALLAGMAFSATRTITFTEDTGVLRNPGQGWSTMGGASSYRIVDPVVNVGAVYNRFNWANLEPQEGVYNWKPIDDLLAFGEREGLPVSFRIMCACHHSGKIATPLWVFEKGAAFDPFEVLEFRTHKDGSRQAYANPKRSPRFDDPVFLAAHEKFIQALAARYDGNPLLAGLDIGSFGHWGEWHCSGLPPNVPPALARDDAGNVLTVQPKRKYVPPRNYPFEIRRRYADFYLKNFTRTPLVFMSDDWEVMKYALGEGAVPRVGFRRDGVGSPWHFTRWIGKKPYTAIPRMGDVWKTRPVWFEFYGSGKSILEKGWDLPYSVDWLLTNHVTVVNTCPFTPQQLKDDPIHYPLLRKIDLFAGARLVPVRATLTEENGRLHVALNGINKGVAPIHLPYEAVYTFTDERGQPLREEVSSADPSSWLPGPFALTDDLTPPASFRGLSLRLRHVGGKLRDFRFASTERTSSGALVLKE